jgi:hypothetical protein
MLVRAYRLTDKVGVALLKSGAALADTTLTGVTMITRAAGGGLSGLFGTLFMLILGIGRLIYTFLRRLARLIRAILGFFGTILRRILSLFTAGAARSSRGVMRSAGATAADAMARRAARAEMEVGLAEDPLRTQNRTLSIVIIGLIGVVIVVLLWATSPGRNPSGVPLSENCGI